jgi:Raf kinase inhibitor-like YbhB/YbcL family protein
MLEKIPHGVGHALRGVRAGYDKIVSEGEGFVEAPQTIQLLSPAFDDGGTMPARFTNDGKKLSPPLAWSGVPNDTISLALIVEDPDAPMPEPVTHLLAWDLPANLTRLEEGHFRSEGHEGEVEPLGRNALLRAAYLAPDPPMGHGRHLYAFQLFALDRRLNFEYPPGRGAVVEAMNGHVLAKGVLGGIYERA